MIGWILFVVLFVYGIAEEGAAATLVGLAGALGIDVATAIIVGASVADIFTGAGLADDLIMYALKSRLKLVEKVSLSVFLAELQHLEHEAREDWAHTDRENEQYSRWLQRQDPNATYLFGDVTPRDVIDLGLSGGLLLHQGTFVTIWDAVKERFGDLVTATADFIEVGGV